MKDSLDKLRRNTLRVDSLNPDGSLKLLSEIFEEEPFEDPCETGIKFFGLVPKPRVKLEEMVALMKEALGGATFPPVHINCRSVSTILKEVKKHYEEETEE